MSEVFGCGIEGDDLSPASVPLLPCPSGGRREGAASRSQGVVERETLHCGCEGLSPGAGQVMMSVPWSVREQEFSRKLSLKDSICLRDARVKALGVMDALASTGGTLLQPILLGGAACLPWHLGRGITGGCPIFLHHLLGSLSLDVATAGLMTEVVH